MPLHIKCWFFWLFKAWELRPVIWRPHFAEQVAKLHQVGQAATLKPRGTKSENMIFESNNLRPKVGNVRKWLESSYPVNVLPIHRLIMDGAIYGQEHICEQAASCGAAWYSSGIDSERLQGEPRKQSSLNLVSLKDDRIGRHHQSAVRRIRSIWMAHLIFWYRNKQVRGIGKSPGSGCLKAMSTWQFKKSGPWRWRMAQILSLNTGFGINPHGHCL